MKAMKAMKAMKDMKDVKVPSPCALVTRVDRAAI